MPEWVFSAERAYVRAATGGEVPLAGDLNKLARARAAAGAIASRYLAVGTPRSMGFIVEGRDSAETAALSFQAHQLWFKPTDLRCAGGGGVSLAHDIGGHLTSVDQALACDIVCIHTPMALDASKLRRGTHVNVLVTSVALDEELTKLATIVHEHPGLGELAAGLVDGRQLDEITVFVIGNAAIALAVV